MATEKRKDKRKYHCSCGRSFSHKISLKRHRFVSGCPETEELAEQADQPEHPQKPVSPPEPAVQTDAPKAPANEAPPEPEPSLTNPPHWQPAPVAAREPKVDWSQVAARCVLLVREFLSWLRELARSAREGVVASAGLATQLAWRTGVVLLLFAGAYFCTEWAARPVPAETTLATTGPSTAGAAATVLSYHRHLQDQNYLRAYATLTPLWQKELSLEQFELGCVELGQVRYRLLGIEPSQTLHQAWARVELAAYQGNRVREYSGYYLVVYHDELGWRLAETHLSLQGIGPAYAKL